MRANATGEVQTSPLRFQFDCSVKVAFRGSSISSDGGPLLHRELDDALGLTDMAAGLITDPRTGRNGRRPAFSQFWYFQDYGLAILLWRNR